MCGIAGIYGPKASESDLAKLLKPIEHRGERDHRYESKITDHLAMGTHRLGITDELHGRQPFQSKCSLVTVIFNGQIYNHAQLREQLSKEYEFDSECDTEVILYCYLKWGKEFIHHLDGQFGIAIHDDRTQDFILARDPMGIKPLYYCWDKNTLSFSSEIKSLTHHLEQPITELLPGHMLINGSIVQYFFLKKFGAVDSAHDFQSTLKELLIRAVNKRVKKEDAQIASLLSGGIDSSIVTYLASQYHPDVVAYTLADPSNQSDDLRLSKLLTQHLKIKHVIVSPTIQEMGDFYLKHAVYMTESFEPVLTRNAVAYHFVCKRVAQDGFKYCLNGEGADELFGGYDFVKEAPRAQQDELIWKSLSIIHNSYLKMADRASMYTTLEARVPFMDKFFVDFALTLPPEARISGEQNKVSLRALFADSLPDSIVRRRKVGMNEGAGFGVNLPDQSIYFRAVKSHYESNPEKFEQDRALCSKEHAERFIHMNNIEEIYNFARFVEYGFHRLKNFEKRLQLNTPLREKPAA